MGVSEVECLEGISRVGLFRSTDFPVDSELLAPLPVLTSACHFSVSNMRVLTSTLG